MNKEKTLVVIGAQWGDEGKGKIIDLISQNADVVVRFNGGNNAGHTVIVDGKTYRFRLLPSGVISPKTLNIIATGVIVNLNGLLEEIEEAEKNGLSIRNLYISDRSPLVLPYHILLDKFYEEKRGNKKIGTTARGIGPAYTDHFSRDTIHVGDLLDKEVFREKLEYIYSLKRAILSSDFMLPSFEEIYNSQIEAFEKLMEKRVVVTDTSKLIYDNIKAEKRILFEGAQGTLLDINFGTYPFVTSSFTISGGVCVGAGLPPQCINKIVGVIKAYTSRVGEGPFPSEITDELAEIIREKGQEYGTVTRRPRRVGWLDFVALRYAKRINGFTDLAITKLDVLSGLDRIKFVIAYKYNGKIIEEFPSSLNILEKCEPIIEEISGWKQPLKGIKKYEELPENVIRYIERIEKELETKVTIIGTGPARDEVILLKDLWE
ncbi:adenylosuccinate synthase [Dictyoglomus thermophilum]|uniref:Adenylosuccinate synthetase n=2 Tax=Dictyoglomus thermophilum TaxID=14 RepID=B5YDS8_DICT6|nr:adenylosuccinate synthase [Dictyoglomus thermophilum]ACI18416.1 adenylosuccinate synthetase [Dictyoglomus thermophilum H-6-12]MCX7721185.1 adenylosuccinate synthase [Dictyoglomus thermophilum]TYT22793.1 adenylosuccinate synthase [Dictyoglomus thermophilum]